MTSLSDTQSLLSFPTTRNPLPPTHLLCSVPWITRSSQLSNTDSDKSTQERGRWRVFVVRVSISITTQPPPTPALSSILTSVRQFKNEHLLISPTHPTTLTRIRLPKLFPTHEMN
ncbi:hypothetical protein BLNAU_4732 [Blattamonas nauphoetae]|uniref:Uncharacterized protein n=1 Tax=Blattamonas nauphoetae TaxID=2049346 RepID=A0ABQ9Y918_9EUKA|nr:hypothetical protein BLNAU_4732 [Blattamonas nauphoetae]